MHNSTTSIEKSITYFGWERRREKKLSRAKFSSRKRLASIYKKLAATTTTTTKIVNTNIPKNFRYSIRSAVRPINLGHNSVVIRLGLGNVKIGVHSLDVCTWRYSTSFEFYDWKIRCCVTCQRRIQVLLLLFFFASHLEWKNAAFVSDKFSYDSREWSKNAIRKIKKKRSNQIKRRIFFVFRRLTQDQVTTSLAIVLGIVSTAHRF